MIRSLLAATALLATAACATAPVGVAPANTAALDLPEAPPGKPLNEDMTLTRFAFGSCNHQSLGQHMWARIMATDPQLFMLIGDNVYGDTGWTGDAALSTLRASYAKQALHPEFAAFRANVPMLTTWDDHDFGFNDGGGSFAFKRLSERIYEAFWDASPAVRSRPGVYESRMIGDEAGRQVQVILLDTRYFRSDLDLGPYSRERAPLGPYRLPNTGPDATMLGDAQWRWLGQELAKPADLRLLVSSIQVLTDAHDYEAWETMPEERARLYDMLRGREDSGLLILSGDRHAGGIYRNRVDGETFWELTSSSLNLAFNDTVSNTAREPDPKRLTDFISEENFGTVDIDWGAEALTLKLLGNRGEVRAERTMNWTAP
jgi:alkaline phosphatase D